MWRAASHALTSGARSELTWVHKNAKEANAVRGGIFAQRECNECCPKGDDQVGRSEFPPAPSFYPDPVISISYGIGVSFFFREIAKFLKSLVPSFPTNP